MVLFSGSFVAREARIIPLTPDGTCPEGFATVNAPFCVEESPNTPGRIFGYGEGDLSSAQSAPASPGAEQTPDSGTDPCPDPNYPRETPDGCQASDLPDVDFMGLCPDGVYADGECLSSEESATPTATSEASASASSTSTPSSTATATPTATQDPAADEPEDEQASSEERKAKQDEATRSEEPEDRTRSVKQTPLPETDEASNRYPVALAGITFVGLVVSGLLAARAILPWRR